MKELWLKSDTIEKDGKIYLTSKKCEEILNEFSNLESFVRFELYMLCDANDLVLEDAFVKLIQGLNLPENCKMPEHVSKNFFTNNDSSNEDEDDYDIFRGISIEDNNKCEFEEIVEDEEDVNDYISGEGKKKHTIVNKSSRRLSASEIINIGFASITTISLLYLTFIQKQSEISVTVDFLKSLREILTNSDITKSSAKDFALYNGSLLICIKSFRNLYKKAFSNNNTQKQKTR